MISIFIFIGALIIASGWAVSVRKQIFNKNEEFNIKPLFIPITLLVVAFLFAMFQPYKLERVDASGVGFKVHLTGNERGISNYEYKTGWVTYNTWIDQFVEMPTSQQHI